MKRKNKNKRHSFRSANKRTLTDLMSNISQNSCRKLTENHRELYFSNHENQSERNNMLLLERKHNDYHRVYEKKRRGKRHIAIAVVIYSNFSREKIFELKQYVFDEKDTRYLAAVARKEAKIKIQSQRFLSMSTRDGIAYGLL